MEGLNKGEAIAYTVSQLEKRLPGKWTREQLEALVAEMCAADLDYMKENGVLDEEGMEGDAYYDDDEAFDFIMERMEKAHGLTEDDEMPYAELINEYMDVWEQYLQENGLISWD